MLISLHIQNYALIDNLDITFEEGFSVITGETGAGKSILLGAIGLLLGERADLKAIKPGAQRCIVEAEFSLSQDDFQDFFQKHDLDFDGKQCIVRRELTASGKSRAFINDTPTTLSDLRELGEQLIDVHSQHQNLLLRAENFQLQTLDAIAQDGDILAQYKEKYKAYRQAKADYEQAKAESDKDKQEHDYLAFQLQQLEDAQLSEDEESQLEQELATLEHAEDIKSALYQSDHLLQDDEQGLIGKLRETERQMQSIAHVFTPASTLAERLDSCLIELRDIASDISNYTDDVDYDPERLNAINERISLLHELKQKFHAPDIPSLISIREQLAERLSHIENSEEYLYQLQQQIQQIETQLSALSDTLTQTRTEASQHLEREMHERLLPLGIKGAEFQVQLTQEETFSPTGRNRVTFLFSANRGIPMQPLSQVASGGEISRLMLCLKATVSGVAGLPTIIFDEIDTGISGHIAERMGETMREMGDGGRQVIAITHLPQIAARGTHHYRVYKTEEQGTTASHITRLTRDERIEEVARMLSGATLTKAALDNAQALLGI